MDMLGSKTDFGQWPKKVSGRRSGHFTIARKRNCKLVWLLAVIPKPESTWHSRNYQKATEERDLFVTLQTANWKNE